MKPSPRFKASNVLTLYLFLVNVIVYVLSLPASLTTTISTVFVPNCKLDFLPDAISVPVVSPILVIFENSTALVAVISTSVISAGTDAVYVLVLATNVGVTVTF